MTSKKSYRKSNLDIHAIYRLLKKEFSKHRMPVVDMIQQQTKNPFKVLVSTILSARTKDAVTTEASARFFSVVGSINDISKLSIQKIEKLIYPVGFYKNKARYLKKLPTVLNRMYNGVIPETIEELVKLPGVGRKTANLVISVAFNKPAICVDVHVHRICNRLGYLNTNTPYDTEMRLRKILPEKYWIMFNSYVVSFGQNTCLPINPFCKICPIWLYCNKEGVRTIHQK